jgi:hypothetical protein
VLEKLEAVERAAAQAAVSRATLDKAIREAHAAGASLRAIAKAANLSHTQVGLIVKK